MIFRYNFLSLLHMKAVFLFESRGCTRESLTERIDVPVALLWQNQSFCLFNWGISVSAWPRKFTSFTSSSAPLTPCHLTSPRDGTGRGEGQVQRARKGQPLVLSASNWRCPFQPALWTWCSLWDGCGGNDGFFPPIPRLRQTDGCKGEIVFPASGVVEGDIGRTEIPIGQIQQKNTTVVISVVADGWIDSLRGFLIWMV